MRRESARNGSMLISLVATPSTKDALAGVVAAAALEDQEEEETTPFPSCFVAAAVAPPRLNMCLLNMSLNNAL